MMEWIMYIIACLSPEHLAKSLKRCSNHNIQSRCCGSSSLRILNAHRVDLGFHHNNSGRGPALAAGPCVFCRDETLFLVASLFPPEREDQTGG